MHFLIALVIFALSLIGSPSANAEVPANVEAPASQSIEASASASLPTYLTEVSTTKAPASQVVVPPAPASEVGVPQPVRCEEDDPCWDCATMGNKICGPVVQPVTPATCEEDQPCWDCSTMGNKQCGPSVDNEADALASFDSQTGMSQVTDTSKLHYVATVPVEPTHLEAGQFTLPDSNKFDTWHIYTWDILTTV